MVILTTTHLIRSVSGVSHVPSLSLHSFPLDFIIGTVMQILNRLLSHLVHSELFVASVVPWTITLPLTIMVFKRRSSLSCMLRWSVVTTGTVSSSHTSGSACKLSTLLLVMLRWSPLVLLKFS